MMERRRLAVVGSRDFKDFDLVIRTLRAATNDGETASFVSGGARGVDTWAAAFAFEREIPCEVIPADWDKHGKAAGILRNAEIVARATHMIAFWDGKSKGTLNAVQRMASAGRPCTVYVRGNAERSDAPKGISK